uniref:SERPIN domain-containing protein n=1 Tax=Panagrellus redivivus TaxID=6233 RepID=A0A7E4VQ61_PANRE
MGSLQFVLPCNFVSVHPSLKKRYCDFFRLRLFKHNQVVTIKEAASAHQIQSVTGQNLQVPDETNFYFKNLADQWDAKLVTTKNAFVKIG